METYMFAFSIIPQHRGGSGSWYSFPCWPMTYILYNEHLGCQCAGNARSQGISCHGIDLVGPLSKTSVGSSDPNHHVHLACSMFGDGLPKHDVTNVGSRSNSRKTPIPRPDGRAELRVSFLSYLEKSGREISEAHCMQKLIKYFCHWA